MSEPGYGEKPAVTKVKTPKVIPCPRCYQPLRMTDNGLACPRHGIVDGGDAGKGGKKK